MARTLHTTPTPSYTARESEEEQKKGKERSGGVLRWVVRVSDGLWEGDTDSPTHDARDVEKVRAALCASFSFVHTVGGRGGAEQGKGEKESVCEGRRRGGWTVSDGLWRERRQTERGPPRMPKTRFLFIPQHFPAVMEGREGTAATASAAATQLPPPPRPPPHKPHSNARHSATISLQ